jgi:glycosyltransferase involved in cell wall biosynthesis
MMAIGKKIWFFNSCRTWGGGEKWHLDMAASLAKDGCAIRVAANKGSELAQRTQEAGLPLVEVAIGNASFLNPCKLLGLVRMFRREAIRCIILNLPADLKAAGLAARLAGVPRIIYRRGSAIPVRDTVLNRFLFRRVVTDIIANSQETKRTILANNPAIFPRERIHVIYNGIDLRQFDHSSLSPIYSRKPGEIVLGHAGRLSPEKNQAFLIDVVQKLKKAGLSITLLIAGKGPQESALKAYAASRGVEKEVVFLGFQKNMPAVMSAIDIFLLSSFWEGFGYVLVEAMAAGKPVVAFNSSSTPEIVCHGKTGYLVPPEDREGFIARIQEFAADSVLRVAFGQAGRRRAREVFSLERTNEQVRALLEVNG